MRAAPEKDTESFTQKTKHPAKPRHDNRSIECYRSITMSDQPTPQRNPSEPTASSVATTPASALTPLPAAPNPDAVAAHPSATANALTPDEQMALFAKDLQENDWGHQPC